MTDHDQRNLRILWPLRSDTIIRTAIRAIIARSKSATAQKRGNKRVVRFPGLCTAARQFGVNRTHLYLVLRGDRISHRLTRKWAEFQKTKN